MSERGRKPEDFQFYVDRSASSDKAPSHRLFKLSSPIVLVASIAMMMALTAAYILVSELNDRVVASHQLIRDLEARTSLLLAEREQAEQLKNQLSSQSAQNAEKQQKYEETIARLQTQVDELSNELRRLIAANPDNSEVRQIDEQVGESRSDVARLANAVFFVSVYYRNLSQDELAEVNNTLFAQLGFSANTIKRVRWTQSNSVLYYDDFSREKANEIAKVLTETLGISFSATEGAGRGISEEERRTSIIVHIRT